MAIKQLFNVYIFVKRLNINLSYEVIARYLLTDDGCGDGSYLYACRRAFLSVMKVTFFYDHETVIQYKYLHNFVLVLC